MADTTQTLATATPSQGFFDNALQRHPDGTPCTGLFGAVADCGYLTSPASVVAGVLITSGVGLMLGYALGRAIAKR